jgi:hypothetical protein
MQSCSCPAGQFDAPCCKHTVCFYLDAGLLDPEPLANLPASAAPVACFKGRRTDSAYAVCSRFGLDLSLRSVGYVATWLDDPSGFKTGMAAIHDGAASLIDAIEALLPHAGEVDLAA